jgi:hypothetical protein
MDKESIKKALECCRHSIKGGCKDCPYHNPNEDCQEFLIWNMEDYINELESENERLSKEREDLRLFDIALGNGKVDMTLGGNTAKSFINAIVQIFEQNNATNFLATTIETVSSGNKYSLVIQKENGQTPSEKLTELKDRIAELEKDNELLRNAKVVYENVDYCYEDLKKAEKRIAELEGEITKLDIINSKLEMDIELLNKQNIDLEIDRDYYQEQFNEQEDFYVEWNKQQLKQFAERLKEVSNYTDEDGYFVVNFDDIDETLKEFIEGELEYESRRININNNEN